MHSTHSSSHLFLTRDLEASMGKIELKMKSHTRCSCDCYYLILYEGGWERTNRKREERREVRCIGMIKRQRLQKYLSL
jgi:hypothetical protein